MARIVRLTPRFLNRLQACGVIRGSAASAVVGAAIRALEAEALPGVIDVKSMMPPTREAFVHHVVGHALWLWYDVTDGEVWMLTATRTPPPDPT